MTLEEQIRSVKRELALRARVYPSLIQKGKLTAETAEHEVAAMRAVLRTLEGFAQSGAETVRWRDAGREKPDSDLTVLLHAPDANDPVWPGYWDDNEKAWIWAEGAPVGDQMVKAWADLPKGAA